MATIKRYYAPSSGAPPHTPSQDAAWNGIWNAAEIYATAETKIVSALTEKNDGLMVGAGTEMNCGARWVTPAMSAHDWTPSDSLKAQVFGRYNANVTTARFHLIVRVMNADCSSEVGVLWEGDLPTALTNGWPGRNTALIAGGGHVHVQNTFTMPAGSHVVFELGATITGTAQYAGISFYIGDDQDSDYPENETTTTQTDDTWFELIMEDANEFVYAGNIPLALAPNCPTGVLWSSSFLKWCDEGETSIGDVYLRGQSKPSLYLGLYNNNLEPAEDDTMSDITEVDTPGQHGYARIQLADGDWTETTPGTFANLQKTFTCSGSAWLDAYGYFITTAATGTAGKLITVEHFSDGPYTCAPGDNVKVTSTLSFA